LLTQHHPALCPQTTLKQSEQGVTAICCRLGSTYWLVTINSDGVLSEVTDMPGIRTFLQAETSYLKKRRTFAWTARSWPANSFYFPTRKKEEICFNGERKTIIENVVHMLFTLNFYLIYERGQDSSSFLGHLRLRKA